MKNDPRTTEGDFDTLTALEADAYARGLLVPKRVEFEDELLDLDEELAS